jgi:hypothetical protein
VRRNSRSLKVISVKSSERTDQEEEKEPQKKSEQKRIVYLKSSAPKLNEVKSRNIVSNGLDKVFVS